MANVYIEPRPKGRPEGNAIEDYVVEDGADNVLKTFTTQKDAIAVTTRWSLVSGISTIRKCPISGARRNTAIAILGAAEFARRQVHLMKRK